jgi:hypothetical protein
MNSPPTISALVMRLRREQVLLQQGDAVDRRLVAGRRQVGVELAHGCEQPHAQALPALVVLADERDGQLPCRGPSRAAGHGQRPRHVEPGRAQRRQLIHLAHLQLKHPSAVDHAPAMASSQQSMPRARSLANGWPAGVRGSAHPRPEHPVRRVPRQGRWHAVAEQPLLVRHAGGVERRPERRIPVGFSWIT